MNLQVGVIVTKEEIEGLLTIKLKSGQLTQEQFEKALEIFDLYGKRFSMSISQAFLGCESQDTFRKVVNLLERHYKSLKNRFDYIDWSRLVVIKETGEFMNFILDETLGSEQEVDAVNQ